MSIEGREWQQIRREIKNMAQSMFYGFTDSTQPDDKVGLESIQSLVPGMPTITKRPVMHPFGLYSRAVPGTMDVVAMQNGDPAALLILGHRDTKRPKLDDDGDVILYDGTGKHTIKLSKSKGVEIAAGSDDPVAITGKGITEDAGSGAWSGKGAGATLDGGSAETAIKSSLKVTITDGVGTITMTGGTFKFQGGAAELMNLLGTFVQDMLSAQVMTALGPQPFLPTTIVQLTQLLVQLQSISG
jgi:hypothetical protein